jgi:cysteinyl-tRNA synthetase
MKMTIVSQLSIIRRDLEKVSEEVFKVQSKFYTLICEIVALQQQERINKNYVISDKLREILISADIVIQQGTAGHKYDEIPEALKSRPIGDTWTFKE